MASLMFEPHRSKISEKDTSENVIHTYDAGLLEDVHFNEKHQQTMQVNVIAVRNWETYNENIFSLHAPALRSESPVGHNLTHIIVFIYYSPHIFSNQISVKYTFTFKNCGFLLWNHPAFYTKTYFKKMLLKRENLSPILQKNKKIKKK